MRKIKDRAREYHAWAQEARMYDRILPAAFLGGILLFLVYYVTLGAPIDFPISALVNIPEGATTQEVAQELKAKHIINSVMVFEVIQRIVNARGLVYPGEYFFPARQGVITVALRLVEGDHELVPIRVTIPEGATVADIAQLLAAKIPDFDSADFLKIAKPKEGRLFPDTYFFLPGEDYNLALTAFENNFDKEMGASSTAAAIAKSGHSEGDLLVMGSLLEKEASNTQDREEIAGILWHRIQLGMPLQVDAVFPYILGKNTFQVTKADLATTSPYNTYNHKGLPPGPIDNPSLNSILAAAQPTKSNYLYYMSDLQANLHYCATYSCQLANQAKYLGN